VVPHPSNDNILIGKKKTCVRDPIPQLMYHILFPKDLMNSQQNYDAPPAMI